MINTVTIDYFNCFHLHPSMESLIKKKQKIEQELMYYRGKHQDIIIKEEETKEKLRKYKEELEKELKTFGDLGSTLKNKKSIFIGLKKEIKTYKEKKLVEIRNLYLEKYKNYLKEISELSFRFNYNIFSIFERAVAIYDKIEFENLQLAFHNYIDKNKCEVREKILESINSKLKDKKKVHEVLFYLRFLIKYELFFKEPVMIDFLYDNISQEFEYHFLSNKETNRLDKPEWIFEFLINKIKESKRLYLSYEEIYVVERMSHKDCDVKGPFRPTFEDFILRTKILVNIKINELENHKSNQKRQLVLNFGVHLIKFMNDLKLNHNISLDFEGFSEIIDKIQLDYVLEKLENVHEKRYTEWFPMYEDITREVMVYICKFKPINHYLRLAHVINFIIEYNSIFIDSMRYIKREEIKALCTLYDKFDNYKNFLIDTENELILEKISKEGGERKSFINEEEMIELLDKITRFNSDNLKLLKNLIENDLTTLLHTLKRFKYSAETTSRNFIIELSRILEDYKECKAYKNLYKLTGSLTDKYILEDVLLRNRFDKEELLDFNFFFGKLKQFYNTDAWESQEALNCIKDLLEGKNGEGPLFSIISKLYERDLDL